MRKFMTNLRKGRERRTDRSIIDTGQAASSSTSVSAAYVYYYLHLAEESPKINSGQTVESERPLAGCRGPRNEIPTDSGNDLSIHSEGNRPTQLDPTKPEQPQSRNDTLPKTRAEVAQQKLLQASEDLSATLQDYLYEPASPTRHNEAVIPPEEALIISKAVNPEGFARAVEQVLAKQQEKSEGTASKIADALGKMYPLLSLSLSLGSSVVSLGGAQLAPLQCAMNGASLLLSIAYQEHGRGDDFGERQPAGVERQGIVTLPEPATVTVTVCALLGALTVYVPPGAAAPRYVKMTSGAGPAVIVMPLTSGIQPALSLPAPVQTVPPHPLLMYCTPVVLRFTQTDVLFRIASCRAPFRMVWSSWAPAVKVDACQ